MFANVGYFDPRFYDIPCLSTGLEVRDLGSFRNDADVERSHKTQQAISIDTLRSRDDIPQLLTALGLTHWGAEIGVHCGEYSDILLARSRLEWLFSVDSRSCVEYSDTHYDNYLKAFSRLWKYGLRSVHLKMLSVEATLLFQDGALDFAYIDAAHDYESVRADIAAWWPKIGPGGILAGHDYCVALPGVIRAVDEFAAAEKLKLHLTALDTNYTGDPAQPLHTWLFRRS